MHYPMNEDYKEIGLEEVNELERERDLENDYQYHVYRKKIDDLFDKTSNYFKTDPLWSITFEEMIPELTNILMRNNVDPDEMDQDGDSIADIFYDLERKLNDPKSEINKRVRSLALLEAEKELGNIVRKQYP